MYSYCIIVLLYYIHHMSNFITFGCWNKGNCNPDPSHALNNSLSKVIAKMGSYIRTLAKKPAFVCVAGDNYYPDIHTDPPLEGEEKGKKTKTLSIPNLQSGFECLKQFHNSHRHIPIDIIAGNHDIENTNKMTVIQGSAHVVEEPCIITKAEIESTIHHRMMNFTMFNYRVIEKTLVIMIDSNIYCEKMDTREKIKCYEFFVNHTLYTLNLQQLHDNSSPIIDVSQLKEIQKRWLITVVYASISRIEFANVVIVAHHPFALYKIKDGNCRYDTAPDEYLEFCHSIYNHLSDNNNARHFFYSCADLHTYQSGIVTINIEGKPIIISQEIAGTGGTDLETEVAEMECPSTNKGGSTLSYSMTLIQHSHGFLHWSVQKSGRLVAQFIPIDSYSSKRKSKHKRISGRSSSRGGTKRRMQRTSKRRSNRQRRMRRRRSRSRLNLKS